MATISIVLKAIDQYSGVITGLNQGFELVGKAIAGIKFVADAAWAAVKFGAETAMAGVSKAVELAKLGGAFDEQRNQFENLAQSYGLVGQKIVDIVKETSGNTISEFESIKTATKAVAAGFKGADLESALTYIKKWSESTGESFTSVAEKVFTSLSSGRYSVLRQMGLVIENGAKLNDVTAAITEGLKRFGDTGFNTADKIDALAASQDDFARKIGQGVNQSVRFQEVLGGISDGVVKLVKNFDAKPITVFVNTVIESLDQIIYDGFAKYPDVWRVWNGLFENGSASAKNWGVLVTDIVFNSAKSIAGAVNQVMKVLDDSGITQIITALATSALQVIRAVTTAIPLAVSTMMELVLRQFQGLSKYLADFANESPISAKLLGFNAEQLNKDVKFFDDAIASVSSFADAAQAIDDVLTKAQGSINNLGAAASDGRIDIEAITRAQNEFKKAIENTPSSPKGQTDPFGRSTSDLSRLRSDSGIDKLEKDLDDMIEKVKKPASAGAAGVTGTQAAASSGSSYGGIVRAGETGGSVSQITAGLNGEAVLTALGKWLLDYIVGRASSERTPMAVLAAV